MVNRKDWEQNNSSYVCIKHSEDKYYQKVEFSKRFRLIKTLKLVAAIFDPCNPSNSLACQVTSSVLTPKKSPRKCVYQENQYQRFLANYVIKNVSNINGNLGPSGYLFQQYGDRAGFFLG